MKTLRMRHLIVLVALSLGPLGICGATQTHILEAGPNPVTVAVIDTGHVDGHPSLRGRIYDGYNFINGWRDTKGQGRGPDSSPDISDVECGNRELIKGDIFHGTQVAGVIAANGAGGIKGINPKAMILPVRTIGHCGMNMEDFIDGIRWAAGLHVHGVPENTNPARVINISMVGQGGFCTHALQTTINEAAAAGVFIVVAAGQSYGKLITGPPATCKNVIVVGAKDNNNNIAQYSAIDPRITIYAPGGGVEEGLFVGRHIKGFITTSYERRKVNGQHTVQSIKKEVMGTSFAAALVSGHLSLWLSHDPSLTPSNFAKIQPIVEAYIEATNKKKKPQGSLDAVAQGPYMSLPAR